METLRFSTLSTRHPTHHVALHLRIGERNLRRRVGDDAPVVEREHAPGKAAYHLHVVLDEQHRGALGAHRRHDHIHDHELSSADTPLVGSSSSRILGLATMVSAISSSFLTPPGSTCAFLSRYSARPKRSSMRSATSSAGRSCPGTSARPREKNPPRPAFLSTTPMPTSMFSNAVSEA